MKQFLVLFCCLIGFSAAAQPSAGIGFKFRLFDKKGRQINLAEFCQHYQLLGEGFRNDQTSCTNEYISGKYFYNDSTGFFNGDGTVVYGNLPRIFIHKTDTMLLELETNGGRRTSYTIDSLVIKPGRFFISERELKHIDFATAAVAYYNDLLIYVIRLKELLLNYQDSPIYIDLVKLKKNYGIKPDDFEPKTLKELEHKLR